MKDCNCEHGSGKFKDILSTANCEMHNKIPMNKPMTNDNWIDKLWDKHCKLGGYCVKNPSLFEKDVQAHISKLLTKKDQEHKAELERIRGVFWEEYHKNSDYYSESTEKGELDNSNEAAYTTSVLNQIVKGLRDKGIELEKYEIQKDKE